MIKLTKITEENLSIIESWWEDYHNSKMMPRVLLPENGLGGMMLSKNNQPICAGYVYFTNSGIAWIEWITADKNYREEDREQLIVELIKALESFAKENGVISVFTTTASKSLVEKYKKCGFSADEQPSYELIKTII